MKRHPSLDIPVKLKYQLNEKGLQSPETTHHHFQQSFKLGKITFELSPPSQEWKNMLKAFRGGKRKSETQNFRTEVFSIFLY